MEYMSQYNCTIKYINGDNNCVADALSCLPNTVDTHHSVIAGVFKIRSDPAFVHDIKEGYRLDPWCRALAADLARGVTDSKLDITSRNSLIFIANRLIIPKHKHLCEDLF